MLKLILVRHGETDYNKNKIVQGILDVELNELGRDQARKVGFRLKDMKIDAVYSSPLKRALDTAKAIAEQHNIDIVLNDNLKEFNYGDMEGVTGPELDKFRVSEFGSKEDMPFDFRYPGGESRKDVHARAKRALVEILSLHKEGTIVIVAHGGLLRWLLKELLKLTDEETLKIKLDNTSVTIFEIREHEINQIIMNCTEHLH